METPGIEHQRESSCARHFCLVGRCGPGVAQDSNSYEHGHLGAMVEMLGLRTKPRFYDSHRLDPWDGESYHLTKRLVNRNTAKNEKRIFPELQTVHRPSANCGEPCPRHPEKAMKNNRL